MTPWLSLVQNHPAAKSAWKNLIGTAMVGYSTRGAAARLHGRVLMCVCVCVCVCEAERGRSQADFDKFLRAARAGRFAMKF